MRNLHNYPAWLFILLVFGCSGSQTTSPNVKIDSKNPTSDRAQDSTRTPEKTITNSIGMKLVLIPAGEFMMGTEKPEEELAKMFNPGNEIEKEVYVSDEYPRHRVRITKPFYLGAYHVTVGQFRQFVSETQYQTDAEQGVPLTEAGGGGTGRRPDGMEEMGNDYTWTNVGFEQTQDQPVVNVSWNDAMAFCQWLSRKEGKKYRLPTEAEWEYACRAGSDALYCNGNDPEKLAEVGNICDASVKEAWPDAGGLRGGIAAKDGYVMMAPVGKFKPNAWGLYDMHGNAQQLCDDYYDSYYYDKSPANDPCNTVSDESAKVPKETDRESTDQNTRNVTRYETPVVRGSSFVSPPIEARYSRRAYTYRIWANYETGFRIALNPE